MKTQHTPGKWKEIAFDDSRTCIFSDDKSNPLICTVSTGEGCAHGHANAALIASAPELLAALQGLVRTWEHLSNEQIVARFSAQVSGPIVAARAALASATPQGKGKGE